MVSFKIKPEITVIKHSRALQDAEFGIFKDNRCLVVKTGVVSLFRV